jgi:hypothetical protein
MSHLCSFAIALFVAATLHAGTLVIQAPKNATINDARATSEEKAELAGIPHESTAKFDNIPAGVSIDVRLTIADGTVLQGVNLGWYNDEPLPVDVPPMTDDDREQIRAIVEDIPSFYNKSNVLLLVGDHSRATALVQLVRDTDFHSGGGNVVWRVELYYFKFQYGGWEKVQQQNKIIRRERFKSIDAYKSETDKLKWVAELGGIKVGKDETRQVNLESDQPIEKPK